MKSKDEQIKQLKATILNLKAENKYLKSPPYLFKVTEVIQNRYSILLNPPFHHFATTHKQKACTFEVDINDIVCVKSEGKIKWIYLSKKQKSISGVLHESDKLSFTGSIEDFCKKYDAPKIHFCIVSRSVVVNVNHYVLDSNKLRQQRKTRRIDECNNIIISSRFVKEFIERKRDIEFMISFQKNGFHSK